ncbi:NAD(P)/FAD-dependent oxidoreductase [Nocardioides sp. AE5]|uniref:NAD(P)/FAD-dependent oxidoreductase n=1 Tax=Nocardioides sp. AE5 TaxID=2962573 RepID=UPI0028825561|nr:NAD(P)/FAD-dependent oxidoreductase [Nocardioides sp. AE5]MDT0200687.1 NAD(P)/FAD-dependent oxidoreductase [Nocardioides sp. AE5]
MTTIHDVIIVGGGPAGLQAALTLGRMHRDVVLLDSGTYRNDRVEHMHNFVTHDGTPPAEFRKQARTELAAYATVEVRDVAATRIEHVDDVHRVTTEGGVLAARLLILATGVRDELPEVPGLAALWGTHAYTCPFCHGHELAGRDIGILATETGLHLVALLAPIGRAVTVFTDGADLAPEALAAIERAGATVDDRALLGFEAAGDGVWVSLAGGEVTVAGLFVATGRFVQAAPFAGQLGLDLQASGCIAIDDFGRTSRPGVFAAGDLAHRAAYPMPMASVLAAAAAGQLAASACVQELIAH